MQEPVEKSEIIGRWEGDLAKERKSHYGEVSRMPRMSKSGARRGPFKQSILIAKDQIPTYMEHFPVPFTLPF